MLGDNQRPPLLDAYSMETVSRPVLVNRTARRTRKRKHRRTPLPAQTASTCCCCQARTSLPAPEASRNTEAQALHVLPAARRANHDAGIVPGSLGATDKETKQ